MAHDFVLGLYPFDLETICLQQFIELGSSIGLNSDDGIVKSQIRAAKNPSWCSQCFPQWHRWIQSACQYLQQNLRLRPATHGAQGCDRLTVATSQQRHEGMCRPGAGNQLVCRATSQGKSARAIVHDDACHGIENSGAEGLVETLYQ